MEDVKGRLLEIVEDPESTANQFDEAARRLEELKRIEQ